MKTQQTNTTSIMASFAIIKSLSKDEYLVTRDNYLDKIDSLSQIIKNVNAEKLIENNKE